MCKHNIISLLNLSGLKSNDALGFQTDDGYPRDPHCESTRDDCTACSAYLSTFPKTTMRRVRWKPEQLIYYCTGCKKTKPLPPKGTVSTELPFCGSCKTKMIDALSDTYTYLTSSMTRRITQGEEQNDTWTLASDSDRRSSITWLQALAEKIITAWLSGLMEDSTHLPVL